MGLWTWAPLTIFLLIWTGTQARLGWFTAGIEAVVSWAVLIGSRGLGMHAYNVWVAPRWPLSWQHQGDWLVRLETVGNIPAVVVLAVPFGVFFGEMANFFGWTTVLPDRWVVVPLALIFLGGLYGLGNMVLYNGLIVRWWGPVAITLEKGTWLGEAPKWSQLRRTVTLMTFSWMMGAVLLIMVVAGALLMVVAHHFPAGWFGVEMSFFGLMLSAFIAFVLAVLVGWWYGLGVVLSRLGRHWWGAKPWGQVDEEGLG